MKICKLVRSALAVVGAMAVFAPASAFAAKAYVSVKVYDGQEDRGKVSGGNAYYEAGKTITIKATPNKGYGFAGWYMGSVLESCRSSWKYTTEGYERYFKAKFVAAKNDGFDLTDKKPNGYTLALGVTPVAGDCFAVTTREGAVLSETTVKVSGLPAGVKAAEDPDPTKNGSVVFTGAPTKAGVYYVTFEAKNSNGYVQSLTQKWVVGGVNPKDGDFDEGCMPSDSALSAMQVGKAFTMSRQESGKKLTMSGIPAGLKFTSYRDSFSGKLCSELKGYPSKPGKYAIGMVLTCDNGTVQKGRKTVIVKDSGSYYVTVDVGSSSEGLGIVSGSGVYRVGSKIHLSAKPVSKGCVFAGWFTDKACTKPLVSNDNRTALGDYFTASGEYRNASDSMTLYYEAIGKARTIYAKFLPTPEDSISLSINLGGDKWFTGPMDIYMMQRISYSVSSESLPTVSAKNLPPGFRLDTKNSWIEADFAKVKPAMVYENVQLIAKNQTGKTATKTFTVYTDNFASSLAPDLKSEVDAYDAMVGEDIVYGKLNDDLSLDDHKGDWKVSVSGLPSGVKAVYNQGIFYLTGIMSKSGIYTPVFTFTRGSGIYKQTEKFSFTISVKDQYEALLGTFNGVTSKDAAGSDIRTTDELVTITSSKGGKLSAKVGKMALSGSGLRYDDEHGLFTAELFAHAKEDGHNIQYTLEISADPVLKAPGSAKNITGGLWRHDLSIAESERKCYFFAKQNWFGKKYWPDDRAAELAANKTMYFNEGDVMFLNTWNNLVATTDTKALYKVTVDKKGVMKLSAVLGGKARSGSATLIPEADGSLTGYLPISYKGSCGEAHWIFRFTYKNGVPRLELKYDGSGACG